MPSLIAKSGHATVGGGTLEVTSSHGICSHVYPPYIDMSKRTDTPANIIEIFHDVFFTLNNPMFFDSTDRNIAPTTTSSQRDLLKAN